MNAPLLNTDSAVTEGLVVESIGKSFRGRPVVKNVSMRLARGEVAGLLGPNGAGKTTCFYMITGLIPVDYGKITLDGQDITSQPMYQRARMGLGYLPQEASIFRGMTVEQNVRAVAEMHIRSEAKVREVTNGLLHELRIDHLS
ncbi:MAG TPA: ATP-binding cassette domain-containing protein, partial [Caulobacteraceae bacterium]|nr:ATP-binding cassette domain-containing protein [Caulobacteraceae bacterium]